MMRRVLAMAVVVFLLAWAPVAFAQGSTNAGEYSRVILWDDEPPRSTSSRRG
jgi:hypothetical protein